MTIRQPEVSREAQLIVELDAAQSNYRYERCIALETARLLRRSERWLVCMILLQPLFALAGWYVGWLGYT